MKISTRGRYGLRAMVDIAANESGNCVTLKSIAERQGISEHYLEQLASVLKKAGFVKSVRGSQGGYRLGKSPAELSVGDILRVLEGSMVPVECLSESEKEACGSGSCSNCVTKPIWEKIYASLNEVLDGITLEELADNYKKIEPEKEMLAIGQKNIL